MDMAKNITVGDQVSSYATLIIFAGVNNDYVAKSWYIFNFKL